MYLIFIYFAPFSRATLTRAVSSGLQSLHTAALRCAKLPLLPEGSSPSEAPPFPMLGAIWRSLRYEVPLMTTMMKGRSGDRCRLDRREMGLSTHCYCCHCHWWLYNQSRSPTSYCYYYRSYCYYYRTGEAASMRSKKKTIMKMVD